MFALVAIICILTVFFLFIAGCAFIDTNYEDEDA
jgi:hypothetical protein